MAIKNEFLPNYAVHPGVILKEDMEMVGMTQKELSDKTGISKTVINEIIKGKRKINAEIAVLLEGVLFSPAKYWLNLQSNYEEALARIKLNKPKEEHTQSDKKYRAFSVSFGYTVYSNKVDKTTSEAA